MFLLHLVSSVRWGGPERYSLDICRHYTDMGWRVEAFTRDARAVDSLFSHEGVELHHAPLQGLADLSSARLVAGVMGSMPYGEGVVHAHRYRDAFTALLARRLARRPDVRVVMTRHTVERARNSWLCRAIYSRLDAHIFVSQAALDRFLATWRGSRAPLHPERLHVLHNSLYLPGFTPQPQPSRGPVVAMYHGRLAPGKGLETLIDAMTMLRGAGLRLRIVGSGPPDYADELRRRALTRGVNDMIDWHRYTADPHRLIAESHFGVLPSVREEAFGIANIEYMVNARPQVSTANGAQSEYLTDGREAFLVPPADASVLAAAMRHLASDASLRQRMGEAALTTFTASLSWPGFASRLNEIYTAGNT